MNDNERDARASKSALIRDRERCRVAVAGCSVSAGGVHHIFARGNMRLRWNPLNLLSVCGNCHAWAHAHPVEFTNLVREALLSELEWEELAGAADE